MAGHDLPMTDEDFAFIAVLVRETAGIALAAHKRNLVYGRLSHRVRALGLASFRRYRQVLESPEGEVELHALVNALTTNYTKFFREAHHFQHLAEIALPAVIARAGNAGGKRLRIWSAGCSTGEEPYSAAMVLGDSVPALAAWDARILATDIDTNVLAAGETAIYDARQVRDIPEQLRRRFVRQIDTTGDRLRIAQATRRLVAFRQLNLIAEWPFKGPFDAIFCRNVIIYFDRPTQTRVVERLARMLAPGGVLYLGHSESPLPFNHPLELVGRSIYRRKR